MSIIDNIKTYFKEKEIKQYSLEGYSRYYYENWNKRVASDTKSAKNSGKFSNARIKKIHNKGFLCSTVSKFKINDLNNTDVLPDKKYWHLVFGINYHFVKWIEEISFMRRVLVDYQDVLPKVYYTVHSRNGEVSVLKADNENREATFQDVINLAKEKGTIVLKPELWRNAAFERAIRYNAKKRKLYININGYEEASSKRIQRIINRTKRLYVVTDPVSSKVSINGKKLNLIIKLWLANDADEGGPILHAQAKYSYMAKGKQRTKVSAIDLDTGAFKFRRNELTVPNWTDIKEKLEAISEKLKQISYYSLSIVLDNDSVFKIVSVATYPDWPDNKPGKLMLDYLNSKYEQKRQSIDAADNSTRYNTDKENREYAKKAAQIGFRPYMLHLWEDAKQDDIENTEGISLEQKKWAHERGFLSFRIWQYGLTEDNYKNFLSDRDYHWLNRINNNYQRQINDKTSYRLIMEPFKQYVPKYFFCCLKRNGTLEYNVMPDCPEEIPASFEGMLELLRKEGRLALKASSGTHGDGFYCLAYENGNYFVNDEPIDKNGIERLMNEELKSVYIVTEFLQMHDELKKIYAKTVNTIRIMVINEHGYDPKIMQTYMRIGASKTGYTDNVGYGGICCMVNSQTGELYQPETIKDHKFYPCPNHPDTGTPIQGFIPQWDEVRKAVLEVAEYLGELEYLGFDVAVTDQGVKIIEINIHQDLHKVADHTDEIRQYYKAKIKQKNERLSQIKSKNQ